MKKILAVVFLTALVTCVVAQDKQGWEAYYDQLGDLDDTETSSWESTYDILSDLAASPINLNTASREDLQQLPFLNDQQIEALQEYIYKYGAIKSWGELAMIEPLDKTRQKLLTFFTTIETTANSYFPTLKEIINKGRNELVATVSVPFYERAGFKGGYLAKSYKNWVRYSYGYGRYFKVGLVASQDAGEPFFSGRNKLGYDYYSMYLVIRKMGRLKALAIGRYRLRFGMGLALNNDFGFGKIATLATLGRQANSVNAHSSRTEANYLQGAAATVTMAKGLDVTGFISYRDIDATLNADSATIATILGTGYHRTESEMSRKHNATEFLGGGNVNYFRNGFHAGATALYTSFSREFKPNTNQVYRYFSPAGKSFWNMSVDYGYISRRLSVNGETATGNSGAVATINSVSYQLADNLSLMALQRFYSYKYYAIFGNSYSDGGVVQNESGVYVGANWQPLGHVSIMFYTDYAYFPWAKYLVSRSSHSWDNFISMTYQRGSLSLLVRYRIRARQRNNSDGTDLIPNIEQCGRLSMAYKTTHWAFTTQADVANSHREANSFGWMVSEFVGCAYGVFHVNANVGYFHTDDFDSRLYVYEHGPLYNYFFPSFFGHGVRYSIDVRADLNKRLMLLAKLGSTHYFDRNQISSGAQMINGNTQTDLDLQLRWVF